MFSYKACITENFMAKAKRDIGDKASELKKISSSEENSKITFNWQLPNCMFRNWSRVAL